MRLFLDADVLFTAAHNPAGRATVLLELARERGWDITTSRLAAEEARYNIGRIFPTSLRRLGKLLEAIRTVSPPPPHPCPIPLPEKDQPIFYAAILSRATHLLTGDMERFGPHMDCPDKTAGIVVQTVAAYLNTHAGDGCLRGESAVAQTRFARRPLAAGSRRSPDPADAVAAEPASVG